MRFAKALSVTFRASAGGAMAARPLLFAFGERRDAFLLGCEEASNSDYQDYVFLVENVTAASN
jgi:hypothetical protein